MTMTGAQVRQTSNPEGGKTMKRRFCVLLTAAMISTSAWAGGNGGSPHASSWAGAAAGAISTAQTGPSTSSARTGPSSATASIGDVGGVGSISTSVSNESRNVVWPGGIGGGNTTAPCQKGITAYLFHWTVDDDICYAAYLAQFGHAVNDLELMSIGTSLAHIQGREKLREANNRYRGSGYGSGPSGVGFGVGISPASGTGYSEAAPVVPVIAAATVTDKQSMVHGLPEKCIDRGKHCEEIEDLKAFVSCEQEARGLR